MSSGMPQPYGASRSNAQCSKIGSSAMALLMHPLGLPGGRQMGSKRLGLVQHG
jgi:hypothetical protein